MTEDLYFIPLIVRALREPMPRTALHSAFQSTRDAGRQAAYAVGWRQFLDFLTAVAEAPPVEAGGSSMAEVLYAVERIAPLQLLLQRDGQTVGTFAVEDPAATVRGIHPGSYQLRTDTGWVLWEGRLTARDVNWAEAFPGQNLPMAAQTDDLAPQPTVEFPLLDGSIVLHVYPGLDAGVLTLTARNER